MSYVSEASEASALGVKMPYDEPLIDKWMQRVYARFSQAPATQ
jgi:hypothetical protein